MLAVSHLCKSFKLYQHPSDRLKEILLRRPRHRHFQALNNVSFQLANGEALGVIGSNGAGKSTLLKILNGVLLADSGTVRIDGRTTGLLELGSGFDPNLTGLQNILTNGLLLGMSEDEVKEKTPDIVSFSELSHAINEPLRTYSSGMAMRLAFSIGIHASPQTFLIDEALSVGDASFQQKCVRWIHEFRESGGSVIFVSHDLNALKIICDRILVLNHGEIVIDGEPRDAVNLYMQLLETSGDLQAPTPRPDDNQSFPVSIAACSLEGELSHSVQITSGENVCLRVDIKSETDLPAIVVTAMIRDRFGQNLFETSNARLNQIIATHADENLTMQFQFPMRLAPGKYTISLGLHLGSTDSDPLSQWLDNAIQFEVSGFLNNPFTGVSNLLPSFDKLDKRG